VLVHRGEMPGNDRFEFGGAVHASMLGAAPKTSIVC
jgi:hypothetical protein